MSAARRDKRRRDWPRGLYEPRPGYFVWRHPNGETHALGRITFAAARGEAISANAYIAEKAPGLVSKLKGGGHTVADLLGKMVVPENANTAKSWRSLDKRIRTAIGDIACSDLDVAACAEFLEDIVSEGKARTAEATRSRLFTVCQRGQQLGWMGSNPVTPTAKPEVTVRRGRLTLDAFLKIHARAAEAAEWLPLAMMLALVSGQDRSTVAKMQRTDIARDALTVWRGKTRKHNQPVEIPLALRMDVVGTSLTDLVKNRTGVVSRFLVHHVRPWGNAPAGSAVHPNAISRAFTSARQRAGIPDELPDGKAAPTFHEIRSLSKRLYLAQGNVDTKALLGHATDRMGALYADPRGVEPVRVRIG